jgi:surface carbohydrate biosynthesis protein
MKPNSVAFIIDNPLRDLPGIVLCAHYLAKNGVKVFLIPFQGCASYLYYLKPEIAVLNYARPNNATLIKRLAKCNITVTILDTEGGVFGNYKEKNTNDYYQTVIQDSQVRNYISSYFVWGNLLFKELTQKGIYNTSQLKLTGTPRTDFYHHSLSSFFQQKLKNYILISSSFPMINPKFQTVEAEKQMMIQTFNYTSSYIEKLFNNLLTSMMSYIDYTIAIAKHFPDEVFIFRPHPFENEQLYLEKFSSLKNLQVIKTGTIGEWIANCKTLIHFESSSSFEAAFSSKPVFAFSEFKEIWDIKEIQSITEYASSTNDMILKIEKVLKNEYSLPSDHKMQVDSIVHNIYYKLDGRSHERVCDELLKILPSNKFNHFKLNLYFLVEILKRAIKYCTKKLSSDQSKFLVIEDIRDIGQRLFKEEHHWNLVELPLSPKMSPAVVLTKS